MFSNINKRTLVRFSLTNVLYCTTENKDIIEEKDFRLFKKYVLAYVEHDSELKGGLCTYRLMDDPDTFLEIMETSLEN